MKIKDIGRVVTGKTPLTGVNEYYGGNIMFISPSDLHGDYLIEKSEKTITEEGLKSIESNSIDGISVLTGCIGWDMGNVAMCNSRCATNQQINAIIDFNHKLVDPRYVYYWLKGKKDYLFSIASVTRTPILSKSVFENIDIPLPSLKIQERVTKLLSLIDEKIRKNHQINDYLEQQLQLLYDYWFTQYNFPNEDGQPYKASNGLMVWNKMINHLIPADWKVKPLGTICSFRNGINYDKNVDGKVKLQSAIANMSPKKFEQFSRALLTKMGVQFTDKGIKISNDGGIDGYGYHTDDDDFRTTRVVIQCKRYNTAPVSEPDINQFLGAMNKFQADYGVFITNSRFTNAAREAAREGTPITLIDGNDLVRLVIKYELYITPVTTYVLDDFYDEE